MLLSDRDHTFNIDEGNDDNFDLATVILHELGHFIGMKHQTSWSIRAVMNPTLAIYEDKRTLFTDDITTIQSLYNANGFSASLVKSSAASIDSDDEEKEDDTLYRGVIELRKNGDCVHYFNEQITHKHNVTF